MKMDPGGEFQGPFCLSPPETLSDSSFARIKGARKSGSSRAGGLGRDLLRSREERLRGRSGGKLRWNRCSSPSLPWGERGGLSGRGKQRLPGQSRRLGGGLGSDRRPGGRVLICPNPAQGAKCCGPWKLRLLASDPGSKPGPVV